MGCYPQCIKTTSISDFSLLYRKNRSWVIELVQETYLYDNRNFTHIEADIWCQSTMREAIFAFIISLIACSFLKVALINVIVTCLMHDIFSCFKNGLLCILFKTTIFKLKTNQKNYLTDLIIFR